MDAPHKRRQLLSVLPSAQPAAAPPSLALVSHASPGVSLDTLPLGLSAAMAIAIAFAVIFFLVPDEAD